LVYAFTTVATQAVVRPERAGEAAGVTLTALEILERGGTPTAAAINTILGVLAALLLAASAVVLWIARAATESARSH